MLKRKPLEKLAADFGLSRTGALARIKAFMDLLPPDDRASRWLTKKAKRLRQGDSRRPHQSPPQTNPKTKAAIAEEFLARELSAVHTLRDEVTEAAVEQGIAPRTLRRAFVKGKYLALRKGGIGSRGYVVWRTPLRR